MRASILLLAPEPTDSDRIRQVLEQQGHHVLAVPTAAVALGALRHVHFDLLVLPLVSSTISAQDLSTQAKLLQPQLRLLVISEIEDAGSALSGRFEACVRAPFSDAALEEQVLSLVQSREDTGPHGSAA